MRIVQGSDIHFLIIEDFLLFALARHKEWLVSFFHELFLLSYIEVGHGVWTTDQVLSSLGSQLSLDSVIVCWHFFVLFAHTFPSCGGLFLILRLVWTVWLLVVRGTVWVFFCSIFFNFIEDWLESVFYLVQRYAIECIYWLSWNSHIAWLSNSWLVTLWDVTCIWIWSSFLIRHGGWHAFLLLSLFLIIDGFIDFSLLLCLLLNFLFWIIS